MSKITENFNPELIQSGVLDQAIGLLMPNLVGLKSLNRLEQVLLKKEAHEKGLLHRAFSIFIFSITSTPPCSFNQSKTSLHK